MSVRSVLRLLLCRKPLPLQNEVGQCQVLFPHRTIGLHGSFISAAAEDSRQCRDSTATPTVSLLGCDMRHLEWHDHASEPGEGLYAHAFCPCTASTRLKMTAEASTAVATAVDTMPNCKRAFNFGTSALITFWSLTGDGRSRVVQCSPTVWLYKKAMKIRRSPEPLCFLTCMSD